jgi:hypothetical protein
MHRAVPVQAVREEVALQHSFTGGNLASRLRSRLLPNNDSIRCWRDRVPDLGRKCGRRHRPRSGSGPPVRPGRAGRARRGQPPGDESTDWRAFALVSRNIVGRVLGGWLHIRAVRLGGRPVIAIDGKAFRGAKSSERRPGLVGG